jgi:hypothetical protein
MTVEFFFWYVLPFIIAAVGFGWLVYDHRRDKQRPHPGE